MAPTTEPQAKTCHPVYPEPRRARSSPFTLSLEGTAFPPHSLALSRTIRHAKGFSSASACAVEVPAFFLSWVSPASSWMPQPRPPSARIFSLTTASWQPCQPQAKPVIPTEAARHAAFLARVGLSSGGICFFFSSVLLPCTSTLQR